MLELVEIASVRRSEWRQMVLMITEHPEIGRKVGELDLGVAVRRMVLVKSKVLVYYAQRDTDLLILSVLHGMTEKRPLEGNE